MTIRMTLACLAALIAFASASAAEPPTTKVRITGLFSPDREKDLRELFAEQWPEVKIAGLDLDRAEAILNFDADKLFPKGKPAEIVAKLDEKVRNASNGTFGVKPASAVPRDKLVRVEIAAAGLDCKACCLAAYEIVAKIEGVEQATVIFKEGRISALLDPMKTDKAKLEAALKQRGVGPK